MLRVVAIGLATAVALHAVIYRWRLMRARHAAAERLPTGVDGIIPGAEPMSLRGSNTHAALLIHGFGDTPQTVRSVGEYLNAAHGWTIRAPLLPGHGRTLAAFDATNSAEWRALVHVEYVRLKSEYPTVVLVGLSMGGALATLEAARDPALPALVLLAPYLTPPASAQRLAPLAGLINLMMPYLAGGDRERSIFDPDARARALGYGGTPPKRIRDLVSVAHDARFAAAEVHAPTLLIHSRSDYRIPLPLAESHPELFAAAAVREQQWVTGCGHVITVDYCREQVWAATAVWLARFAGAPVPAANHVV